MNIMHLNKSIMSVFMVIMASCFAVSAMAKSSSSKYKSEIKQAEYLGKIIYEKDIAAWVGTDKMLAELGKDISNFPLKGWVTDKDDGRYRVNFIGEKDGETKIYYQAWTKRKKVKKTEIHKQGIALTSNQLAMWTARKLVAEQKFKQCAKKYNTVVVPYEQNGNEKLYVYLFASTTDINKVKVGGHHRYTVSENGQIIEGKIAFSNSCLTLDKGQTPAKSTMVGLTMSHVKTNYPQEHHVFISLSQQLGLYVIIPKTGVIYKIKNGKIRKMPSH